MLMDQDIQEIIQKAGGASAVARSFDPPITSQAVSQWRRIPADRVLVVAKLAGVTPNLLRPDIFTAAVPQ